MDLAACAKRVFFCNGTYHKRWRPQNVKAVPIPITAPGAVTMVATDLGLFLVKDTGFELKEQHLVGRWRIFKN
ncbi:MAG: hypothetical protein Ct9H300mP27_12190 [Chloroflexota bacterium]|nr:MAG: hypothetical protein Ct9H300mP27_12190 [Chloroflexota bacterium]